MKCLICKSDLKYETEIDAKEYGFDTNGTVSTFTCSNSECNLDYELIELIEPIDGNSNDFYTYGKRYLRFYDMYEI